MLQVFICLRPGTPYPAPPLLHSVYSIIIHTGGESGNKGKVRGATVYKVGSKTPT